MKKVAGLGPQLFPDLEDSAGHPKVFLLSRRQPLEVPGQMLPCQPAWATHGHSVYRRSLKALLKRQHEALRFG